MFTCSTDEKRSCELVVYLKFTTVTLIVHLNVYFSWVNLVPSGIVHLQVYYYYIDTSILTT